MAVQDERKKKSGGLIGHDIEDVHDLDPDKGESSPHLLLILEEVGVVMEQLLGILEVLSNLNDSITR
ncbi:hypothetical protein HGM15179_014320, partial [Zosterops borbonicus]